ncbi:ABC transporter permease, partial [candidate division KSB1 bacterium]|nr:ABC transporter permease [candidate division KSB1 bacterium]
ALKKDTYPQIGQQSGISQYPDHNIVCQNNRTVEYPICTRKAYTELPAKVPGVKAALQIYRTFNPEIKINDTRFRNLKVWYVDSTFFNVFAMQAVAGNLDRVLQSPNAIVTNVRTAHKLFGAHDPVGQMVMTIDPSLPPDGQLCSVAAVVPDLPTNSHFDFDILLPMSANQNLERMQGLEFYTYYLLENGVSIKTATASIESQFNNMMAEWVKRLGIPISPRGRLLPIRQIYLHSNASREIGPLGDLKTIRIFAILTILILGIAIANYINLFLLQGAKRTLETGIRKTVGASRSGLFLQYMKESFLITGLPFLIAIYLATILIRPFGDLIRRQLHTEALLTPGLFAGMIGLFLLISFLAGIYPAWYLTKFSPIQVLKGNGSVGNPKHRLRKGMVVLQFAICMLLLTNLLALQKQFNFMNDKSLGFDSNHVVAFQNLSPQIQNAYPSIKNELQQLSDIALVTGSHAIPGSGASGQSLKIYGTGNDSKISIRECRIQPDYFETYGIQLQAGRGFSADRPADRNAIVLNEAAVRALNLTEPIGKQVVMFDQPMEVIGVINDYHYASLREPIRPEAFTYYKDQIMAISIRLSSNQPQRAIEQIKQVFHSYDPDYTPEYIFLHDTFEAMYGGEHQLIRLVQIGSLLALALTLLGLAAITAITAKQRTKEIGIRKAIGATTAEIIRLLVGSQIKLLAYITVIAGIAAAWIIHNWMQNYAYRADIGVWIFLFAGVLVLVVAGVTTAIVSYDASGANPVDALRYE